MQDESRSSIRRTYYEQDSLRHFCGFCGTPLSFWSEAKPADASYISLTLGSLAGSDLQDLEELGLLPKEALEDAENDKEKIEAAAPSPSNRAGGQGLPWFETMVKGSRPGNMQRSWGETRSQNGRYKVEWEIVEWTAADDVEDTARPSKRNIGVVDED